MKYWALGMFFLLALAITGRMFGQTQPPPTNSRFESDTTRVMSFNIRYGTASDGENRWELRRDWVVETIQARQPDLLGTQETLKFQKEFLDAHLTQYGSWGVGRDDGEQSGEMTALWYRQERFEKIDGGHFWLSEQPDRPGSVSWDSALTRMASWVKLRDLRNPEARPILFLNTHFDHRGEKARQESARLIRKKAREWGELCDLVITGDFNAGQDDDPYQILFENDSPAVKPESGETHSWRLLDSYRVVHPIRKSDEGTFSGFAAERTSGPRIDWIAVSNQWRVIDSGIDRTSRDGRTPSDHFPVYSDLERLPR